jgi:hypothetical protein
MDFRPQVHHPALQFLLGKVNELDAETAAKVQAAANGQKSDIEIKEQLLYFRKQINGGSIIPFKMSETDKAVGITNIDKGRLDKNNWFVASGIRLSYGTSATNVAVTAIQYDQTIWDIANVNADDTDLDSGAAGNQLAPLPARRVPIELLNSEFSMSVGGKNLLTTNVKEFFTNNTFAQVAPGAGWGSNYKELGIMKLIPAQNPIEAQIEVPSGVVLPAGGSVYHYIELALMGIAICPR